MCSSDLEPAYIGFHMHNRFIEEQDVGQFAAGIGLAALFGQIVQLLVQVHALGVDQAIGIGNARNQADHQLQEEFVVLMLRLNAVRKPLLERLAPRWRQRANPFFGSRILFDAVFDDKATLLQARQRLEIGRASCRERV